MKSFVSGLMLFVGLPAWAVLCGWIWVRLSGRGGADWALPGLLMLAVFFAGTYAVVQLIDKKH